MTVKMPFENLCYMNYLVLLIPNVCSHLDREIRPIQLPSGGEDRFEISSAQRVSHQVPTPRD